MVTLNFIRAATFDDLLEIDVDVLSQGKTFSTSEVRITCIVAEAELETALRALHDAFELERPEPVDVAAAG